MGLETDNFKTTVTLADFQYVDPPSSEQHLVCLSQISDTRSSMLVILYPDFDVAPINPNIQTKLLFDFYREKVCIHMIIPDGS